MLDGGDVGVIVALSWGGGGVGSACSFALGWGGGGVGCE